MEKYYKISKTRLKELLKAELELDQLEAGGVDNWPWYGAGRQEFFLDVIGDRVPKEAIPDELDSDFVVELDIKDYEEISLKEEGYEDDTLKKCPFCGGEVKIINTINCVFWGKCQKCGAEGALGNTKEKAIHNWNDRA